VDLKIKGGNRNPPLKVGIDTLFYLHCSPAKRKRKYKSIWRNKR